MSDSPIKPSIETTMSKLHELSRIIQEEQAKYDQEVEDMWNSLSPQEQQDCFYAVVKRIHKGDVEDNGTYRYVLYDVFGWGPESYGMGMSCGYMDLHNHIWTRDDMDDLFTKLSEHFNLDAEAVKNWFLKKHIL